MASYLEKNNTIDSRVENNYSQQYSPKEAISIQDSPGSSSTKVNNPQKMTITDLERQNTILKRAKDSIQVK